MTARPPAGERAPGWRAGRGTAATIGLALILAVLTAVCTWAARDADSTSGTAARELRIASAQEAVLEAVLAEHTAQLHYLGSPNARLPQEYAQVQKGAYNAARVRLHTATERVRVTGNQSDRSLATYILLVESRYNTTALRLFEAIDSGRRDEAERLERDETGPFVESLLDLVRAAAEHHRAIAAADITRLQQRSHRSSTLVPAVFGLAFLLLGGCWALLLTLQRDLKRQAGALAGEKALLDIVISASPTLVYWKDAERRYQGSNAAFRELRVIGDAAQLCGRTDEELPLDRLSEVLPAIEAEVLETRAAVMHRQVTVAAPDGLPCSLLLSVVPRMGESGEIEGMIGAGADITHVTDLERQLAQASRLESIGQLAAGVAHEINTPIQYVSSNTKFVRETFDQVLTGLTEISRLARMDQIDATEIRVGLDDLDLEFLSEEVPSALRESEEGLERMAHIVRVMKEFSRSGEECTTIDLNRAVENVVEVSHNEWKDIAQVRLELGADVGEISCHAGELKLALLNIVVNAAQAIGEDCRTKSVTATGTIVVSTVREENGWRISVTDDGPGMTEDVRRRVFDPFFTTKPVGQGTGQGLALAHTSIVRRHGGTLTVVSTPGQGSIFTIHLPVRLPERNLVSAGAASIST